MKHCLCLLLSIALLGLAGCKQVSGPTPMPTSTPSSNTQDAARRAYLDLLSGNTDLLTDTEYASHWGDFLLPNSIFEYAFLDLDGDGVEELLVQYENNPSAFNAVFHYQDDTLLCWHSDEVEMTSRDYPLNNGAMVSEYFYGGTRNYTLFRYNANGERQELTRFFARDELIYPDDLRPCPYYEVDGEETTEESFNAQLNETIIAQRLTDWTSL